MNVLSKALSQPENRSCRYEVQSWQKRVSTYAIHAIWALVRLQSEHTDRLRVRLLFRVKECQLVTTDCQANNA